MAWTRKEIEWWRERDLNPPEGFMPFLELAGRSQRLKVAMAIASERKIPIAQEQELAIVQLFNIYYDDLLKDIDGGTI